MDGPWNAYGDDSPASQWFAIVALYFCGLSDVNLHYHFHFHLYLLLSVKESVNMTEPHAIKHAVVLLMLMHDIHMCTVQILH